MQCDLLMSTKCLTDPDSLGPSSADSGSTDASTPSDFRSVSPAGVQKLPDRNRPPFQLWEKISCLRMSTKIGNKVDQYNHSND